MTKTTTLILGGGFGGLSAAHHLRRRLGREHRIVLVDKSATFTLGATKTWVMLGELDARSVQQSRAGVAARGVELRHAEVKRIDPAGRTVDLDGETLRCDYLVIALGADLDMRPVPGLADAAETFYTLAGAERLRDRLRSHSWDASRLAVLIPRIPFKCPPGPYEAALLLAERAKKNGSGRPSTVSIYTVEPAPMPTAGPEAGERLKRLLAEKGIEAHFLKRTKAVDAQRRTILFDDGSEAEFDLLIAIPPHLAPQVVKDAGLLDQAGWVPVDPGTLEVAGHANVFALGDAASVPLPGRFKPELPLSLPKAGVFAEAQGRVVASGIAARIGGGRSDERFDGKGFCYVETGAGTALRGDGSFFELPHPQMAFTSPGAAGYADKKRWVADWIRTYL